jgi:hypothetical protein
MRIAFQNSRRAFHDSHRRRNLIWLAPSTWPKPFPHCIARRGKKQSVLAKWPSRRATRPAKYLRGFHAKIECPVGPRISRQRRAPKAFFRWKRHALLVRLNGCSHDGES